MDNTDRLLYKIGIVPIITRIDPERDAAGLAKALCAGGIPLAEVTFRVAGAEGAIRLMKKTCPDMVVGAGSILRREQVDTAVQAGAQFVVTPGFDPSLVEYCRKIGLPIYPGCSTATDYQAACKAGLSVVKFFPAEQSGGLAKIKALSAPFPMLTVLPTGGIKLEHLRQYLSCPAVCACGGSYMVRPELIANHRWDEITELCRQSAAIVREVRDCHGEDCHVR